MSQTHIVLVGTDITARTAIDIFAARDQVVLGILETKEDNDIRDINDISVFAQLDSDDAQTVMSGDNVEYFISLGDNQSRKEAYEMMAGRAEKPAASAIHPAAVISPYASLGFGNLVNAGAIIGANASLGSQNLIQAHVTVEPNVNIGNYCHISAGARIGGNVVIEDEVFVGTGAIVHPGVTIGKGALVGAGSVVLRDVEAGDVVHGNPAVAIG